VLLDELSPYFLAPASYALAGIAQVLPELLSAYRTGAGVPFAAYGEEIRDHIEQLNRPLYGFSILHCLPASRTETASAATGTVLRPATLRAYGAAAGSRDVQILPVENDMWRFYRLDG
jgi:hypothetical protein